MYNQGYNNYHGQRRNTYGGGGYGQGQPAPMKKKSGSRKKQGTNGKPVIFGWNKSRSRGFIKFVATPLNKEKLVVSKSGLEYETWVVTVTDRNGKRTMTGFYNTHENKLRIPDLEMVASPSKDYFGKSYVSKRRY